MWLWLIAGLVAVQRLAELMLARRNTRRQLARGGQEAGAAHYPAIVLLHTVWLVALVLTVDPATTPDRGWLAVFVVLQGLRVWVIASLGEAWTTRVIVVPGAPLVRRGPYRFMRHPNYAVVAAEIVVLPLVFHAWALAAGFGIANAVLLLWRIRVEDRALGRG